MDGIPLPLTRNRPLPRADSAMVSAGFQRAPMSVNHVDRLNACWAGRTALRESLIFCRLYSGSVIFSVCILSWMPNESRSVMR